MKEQRMYRFIGASVVLACVLAIAGYYMGWFRVSTSTDNNEVKVNLSADREEIRQDLRETGDALSGKEEKNRSVPR